MKEGGRYRGEGGERNTTGGGGKFIEWGGEGGWKGGKDQIMDVKG